MAIVAYYAVGNVVLYADYIGTHLFGQNCCVCFHRFGYVKQRITYRYFFCARLGSIGARNYHICGKRNIARNSLVAFGIQNRGNNRAAHGARIQIELFVFDFVALFHGYALKLFRSFLNLHFISYGFAAVRNSNRAVLAYCRAHSRGNGYIRKRISVRRFNGKRKPRRVERFAL